MQLKVVAALAAWSDVHANSLTGPAPPKFELEDGSVHMASPSQEFLFNAFTAFREYVKQQTVDQGIPLTVVANGDLLEKIRRTVDLISLNEANILKLGRELFGPWRDMADPGRFVVVRGTEAHVGPSAHLEETLGWELMAMEGAHGERSHYEVYLQVGPIVVRAAHHISSALAHTDLSAPQRELTQQAIEFPIAGYEQPDLQIRSHRHRFSFAQLAGNRAMLTLPAFQLKTPFVHKVASAAVPQIGGALVMVFENGKYYVDPFYVFPKQPKVYGRPDVSEEKPAKKRPRKRK